MQDIASLLLVTHVHIRQGPNGPQIDDQTAAGIAQWCRHFDRVTFYGVAVEAGASSTSWVDTCDGILGQRVRVIALPHAYGVATMARSLADVRAELGQAIANHRHLCFTLGNIVGDWPAVAAWEAIRRKRRYAAWIDRVEPPIIRNKLAGSPLKRIAAEALLAITQPCMRFLLRHSTVALLQGGDSFEHYAASAPDPHCTYDTHTHAADQIPAHALAAKQARVRSGAPLAITYVGRATAMKGPFDWLDTLARLHRDGVPFRATWVGDGPDLDAMRRRTGDLGLADAVDLPGFEGRREVLLQHLRDSDLLLFCHKTPESARCLIESLVCGCPIVGYTSAYARGIVADHGGGLFAPAGNTTGLAGLLKGLHEDRVTLSGLIDAAATSGRLYTEEAVYAHRADLMKRG